MLENGQLQAVAQRPHYTVALTLHHDRLYDGGFNLEQKAHGVYDTATDELVFAAQQNNTKFNCLHSHVDGHLYTGTAGDEFTIYDICSGQAIAKRRNPINCLATYSGRIVDATGDLQPPFGLHDTITNRRITLPKWPGYSEGVSDIEPRRDSNCISKLVAADQLYCASYSNLITAVPKSLDGAKAQFVFDARTHPRPKGFIFDDNDTLWDMTIGPDHRLYVSTTYGVYTLANDLGGQQIATAKDTHRLVAHNNTIYGIRVPVFGAAVVYDVLNDPKGDRPLWEGLPGICAIQTVPPPIWNELLQKR